MSAQAVAFYTYHGFRESAAVAAGGSAISAIEPLYDGRLGELTFYSNSLGVSAGSIRPVLEQNALSDAIDTVIIAGHNFQGAEIVVHGQPSVTAHVPPEYVVTETNRTPIKVPLTVAIDPTDTSLQVRVRTDGTGPVDAIVPQMTELWITTKHEMAKRPAPGWTAPWRRATQRFVNQDGVASTWMFGPARQTFRLTWEDLAGADLTILENMRAQTRDYTEPFWLQPPDDTMAPLIYVELDRDSDWEQVFEAPLNSGLGHRITLPLIEVTA